MLIDTTIRSPNNAPRGNHTISMIVLHATAGSARSALAWLTNPAARVSAHYLIDKGGHIYQLVPDELVAWHAGRASWRGQSAINEISLGIELENANNGRDPYPQAQLDALVELTREKVQRYRIPPENVVRHLDVAVPRGRKNDPAGFDWPKFRALVFEQLPPPPPERPPRPSPPAEQRAALARAVLTEAYRQSGAVEWPDWSMARTARVESLGLPVGPSFDLTVGRRNYIAQSFGRDTLASPIGEWRTVIRLGAGKIAGDPLREALVRAVYEQAGETYRPDWAFHQFAEREPIGPPLTPSYRLTVGGVEYVAATYALDVIYSPVGRWKEIGRLSDLLRRNAEPELAEALLERIYARAGSRLRPTWPLYQYAQREQLGASLGPSFRVSVEGRDYVAEAFALDALICEIGRWDQIERLSALLDM
ncbi:MAG: N-acetylmuramoyl-L-alanine amidase [Chloroflexota bacterium]|nr:MAG: N-acetylmuramoyl-L-alanine amidase [Chloroflexota bacterium]